MILSFCGGCNYPDNKPGVVSIIIDPAEYGWYFVELKEDSTASASAIKVKIDSTLQLRKITIANYSQYAFKVYDEVGVEISSKMKLPAHLSHHTGRHFLSFTTLQKRTWQM